MWLLPGCLAAQHPRQAGACHDAVGRLCMAAAGAACAPRTHAGGACVGRPQRLGVWRSADRARRCHARRSRLCVLLPAGREHPLATPLVTLDHWRRAACARCGCRQRKRSAETPAVLLKASSCSKLTWLRAMVGISTRSAMAAGSLLLSQGCCLGAGRRPRQLHHSELRSLLARGEGLVCAAGRVMRCVNNEGCV
jgi:hypothetical protein